MALREIKRNMTLGSVAGALAAVLLLAGCSDEATDSGTTSSVQDRPQDTLMQDGAAANKVDAHRDPTPQAGVGGEIPGAGGELNKD